MYGLNHYPNLKIGDRVELRDINGTQIVTVDEIDKDGKNGCPVFIYNQQSDGSAKWAYTANIRKVL